MLIVDSSQLIVRGKRQLRSAYDELSRAKVGPIVVQSNRTVPGQTYGSRKYKDWELLLQISDYDCGNGLLP
jgi:hypothetical protein